MEKLAPHTERTTKGKNGSNIFDYRWTEDQQLLG